MGNIVLSPFCHEIQAFEDGCGLEYGSICTDSNDCCYIFAISTTLLVLGLASPSSDDSISTLVRRWEATLIRAVDIVWKDVQINDMCFHKAEPEFNIGRIQSIPSLCIKRFSPVHLQLVPML